MHKIKSEIVDILKNQLFTMDRLFELAAADDKLKYARATATIFRGLDRSVFSIADVEKCLEKQLQLLSKAYGENVPADVAEDLADTMTYLSDALAGYCY